MVSTGFVSPVRVMASVSFKGLPSVLFVSALYRYTSMKLRTI